MKILLVAINAKYIHSNPAVHSLKSCAGEYAAHIDVAEFTINQQPSYILREIYKKHPDVIAFSCYIWNRRTIEEIIPDLHKVLPRADIWAGGPEVSYNAQKALQKWQLRGVMTGAGEGIFRHLAAAYAEGGADGLPAVLDEADVRRIPLDEIPFWHQDLADLQHRILYYESSRGCPFSCSYCLSSAETNMEFRSVRRVCEELDFLLERKAMQVKFIDRTFNCKKDHALPILRHILEHDNGITNFHFEVAADLLDEDYFALLARMRPGAVQLEIGIQSTHGETLAAIRRQMDFGKAATSVRRILAQHNVHVHLDLIAGLPFEDLHTFQKSFQDVYSLLPQQLQLGFLKVLRGTEMEKRASAYEIAYTEAPPYEVLSTKWLSYAEICRLKQMEEVLEIYYNSGQFAHALQFLEGYFDTPYAMYDALGAWYEERGLFGIQSSRIRKYEILLEFGMARMAEAMEGQAHAAFKEYLTYDLYLREHMKARPSFAAPFAEWKEEADGLLRKEAASHALFGELSDMGYRELAKSLHVEIFAHIFDERTAVFFDYGRRDALTNNCSIVKVRIP